MSYVESSLSSDETIKLRGKVSWLSQLLTIIVGICTIPLMGGGLLMLFVVWLKIRSIEFAATDRRIIAKTGIIARRTYEINLKKVESVQVDQGILGRLFNYGTILVSGTGTTTAKIPAIDDPMIFRRRLQDIIELANATNMNVNNMQTVILRE